MSQTMTAKELAAQKFNGITIAKPYGNLLGPIELSAIGFIWGPNYSGKSTLSLGMANAMARYGRVEYVPAEEHFGITLTKKVNRLKAIHQDLHFRHYDGLDELRTDIKEADPTVVFLDSVSVLDANDDAVIDFAQWCRDNHVGLWMVAHANKDGSYKGNSKYAHEADIRIEVTEDGSAVTKKNRYMGDSREITVPMTAKEIDYKSGSKAKGKKEEVKSKPVRRSRSAGRKKKASSEKQEADESEFNAQMDEVEQMMKTAK